MEIVPWGVRGSHPVTAPEMQRYGGNTLCFEIRAPYSPTIIVDAGTGLVPLGRMLPREGEAHIFISHMHLDHVQGLPFFAPIHNPDWTLHIYVPKGCTRILDNLFDGKLFPLRRDELLSCVQVRELVNNVPVQVGAVLLTPHSIPHPGGCLAFQINAGDHRACIISDIEVRTRADDDMVRQLLHKTDLAIVDGHYTDAEYSFCKGWGHTAAERWPTLAATAPTRQLVLCHHAPHRTDAELDALLARLTELAPPDLALFAATEGAVYQTRRFTGNQGNPS